MKNAKFLFLGLLGLAYFYKLNEVCLSSWDAVRNYQNARGMASGIFVGLFEHTSPTFNLLLGLAAVFAQDFHIILIFNALLMLWTIYRTGQWAEIFWQLSSIETAALYIIFGGSLFVVDIGRSLSVEVLTLMVWVEILWAIARSHYLRLGLWTGILLTITYKTVLLLPILILVLSKTDKTTRLKALLLAVSLGIFYVLLGWFLGLSVLTYPKYFVSVFMRRGVAHSTFLNADLSYYFKYLIQFENPLLLLGLVFWTWVLLKNLKDKPSINTLTNTQQVFWAFVTVGIFAAMSLIDKAPRGLIFIYPLLSLGGVLSLRAAVSYKILYSVVFAGILGYNFFLIQKNLYPYTHTQYARVVGFLEEKKVDKILLTNGLGLVPFLSKNTNFQLVKNDDEITEYQTKGYYYVLIDDYCRVAKIDNFEKTRKYKALAQWTEPSLDAPLLHLDHSEFTGRTFDQTITYRRVMLQDSIRLRLVDLNNK
jgi:hypothetical protein